ncbi:MAG: hypothetical protein Wins2KO_25820 [Winogradskyella sp.]
MISYNRLIILLLLVCSCQTQTGKLKVVADLPLTLSEVSGIAMDKSNNVIWMINDSGNKPVLYGVDNNGDIIKTKKIKAKNRDWEDLTMDLNGNLYIGDFGNNDNDSKALRILKISKEQLSSKKKTIKPEIIKFSYPEQKKFPPKKNKRHYDCEAFFHFNNELFLFTKSRVKKEKGKTHLYKLPTTAGKHKAELIDTYTTCNDDECWVTSADINNTGSKMVLLTGNSVLVFSNLNANDFFKSKMERYKFTYGSQKESVIFKNDSTLLIADEYLGTSGGSVYEFKIN